MAKTKSIEDMNDSELQTALKNTHAAVNRASRGGGSSEQRKIYYDQLQAEAARRQAMMSIAASSDATAAATLNSGCSPFSQDHAFAAPGVDLPGEPGPESTPQLASSFQAGQPSDNAGSPLLRENSQLSSPLTPISSLLGDTYLPAVEGLQIPTDTDISTFSSDVGNNNEQKSSQPLDSLVGANPPTEHQGAENAPMARATDFANQHNHDYSDISSRPHHSFPPNTLSSPTASPHRFNAYEGTNVSVPTNNVTTVVNPLSSENTNILTQEAYGTGQIGSHANFPGEPDFFGNGPVNIGINQHNISNFQAQLSSTTAIDHPTHAEHSSAPYGAPLNTGDGYRDSSFLLSGHEMSPSSDKSSGGYQTSGPLQMNVPHATNSSDQNGASGGYHQPLQMNLHHAFNSPDQNGSSGGYSSPQPSQMQMNAPHAAHSSDQNAVSRGYHQPLQMNSHHAVNSPDQNGSSGGYSSPQPSQMQMNAPHAANSSDQNGALGGYHQPLQMNLHHAVNSPDQSGSSAGYASPQPPPIQANMHHVINSTVQHGTSGHYQIGHSSGTQANGPRVIARIPQNVYTTHHASNAYNTMHDSTQAPPAAYVPTSHAQPFTTSDRVSHSPVGGNTAWPMSTEGTSHQIQSRSTDTSRQSAVVLQVPRYTSHLADTPHVSQPPNNSVVAHPTHTQMYSAQNQPDSRSHHVVSSRPQDDHTSQAGASLPIQPKSPHLDLDLSSNASPQYLQTTTSTPPDISALLKFPDSVEGNQFDISATLTISQWLDAVALQQKLKLAYMHQRINYDNLVAQGAHQSRLDEAISSLRSARQSLERSTANLDGIRRPSLSEIKVVLRLESMDDEERNVKPSKRKRQESNTAKSRTAKKSKQTITVKQSKQRAKVNESEPEEKEETTDDEAMTAKQGQSEGEGELADDRETGPAVGGGDNGEQSSGNAAAGGAAQSADGRKRNKKTAKPYFDAWIRSEDYFHTRNKDPLDRVSVPDWNAEIAKGRAVLREYIKSRDLFVFNFHFSLEVINTPAYLPEAAAISMELSRRIHTKKTGYTTCACHWMDSDSSPPDTQEEIRGRAVKMIPTQKTSMKDKPPVGYMHCGCKEDETFASFMLTKTAPITSSNPAITLRQYYRGSNLKPAHRRILLTIFQNWTGLEINDLFNDDYGTQDAEIRFAMKILYVQFCRLKQKGVIIDIHFRDAKLGKTWDDLRKDRPTVPERDMGLYGSR